MIAVLGIYGASCAFGDKDKDASAKIPDSKKEVVELTIPLKAHEFDNGSWTCDAIGHWHKCKYCNAANSIIYKCKCCISDYLFLHL